MPKEDIKIQLWRKAMKVPFIVYAESYLKK